MTAVVIRGDARHLPLPAASVDLIVTSPPYFGLRSYTDDGEHYDGQIGSEATPAEWVAALVDCTREWMRVLKPSGSMFVNLGDKYGGFQSNPGTKPHLDGIGKAYTTQARGRHGVLPGTTPKSLLGLPWRYAIACTDQLGLTLRRDIIWNKPNGLPESVTDRCRSSHEYLFHLVKQPRYYAAVDEIREAYAQPDDPRAGHLNGSKLGRVPGRGSRTAGSSTASGDSRARWGSCRAASGPYPANPSPSRPTSASTTSPHTPWNSPAGASSAGHPPASAPPATKAEGQS